ncbi:MAG: hypothetical protein COV34_00885 [Candidatus Zambryskibacteria bacterium CG10_big_fil_rev_8_21_14_0_10_42_12]|uniref:Uncharacterized protein n=1 Tax=Candidatus Zambryskibacteria bacterium CG10_big_fil_rev_8_21_14_0_10_42_12 TaxID=1975115 RepID=A0A2H0QYA0_9BACT|nr:MAG: hypothetical protein COV34_00885 [Candidatus Zambryskibacteria bacterium CG10_big_fil_rev_8_21_14_0_10_42_12]
MHLLFLFLFFAGVTIGGECEVFPKTPDGVIIDRGVSFNATLREIKPIATRGVIGDLAPIAGLKFEVTLPLSGKTEKKPIVIVPRIVAQSLTVGREYGVLADGNNVHKSWRKQYRDLPPEFLILTPCVEKPIRSLSK